MRDDDVWKARLHQANFVPLKLQHVTVQILPAVSPVVCLSFREKTHKRHFQIQHSSASSGPRIRFTKATDDISDDYIVYLVARTSIYKSRYQRRLIRSSQSLIALTTG